MKKLLFRFWYWLSGKKPVYILVLDDGVFVKRYYTKVDGYHFNVSDIEAATKFNTFEEAAKELDALADEYNIVYLNIETIY